MIIIIAALLLISFTQYDYEDTAVRDTDEYYNYIEEEIYEEDLSGEEYIDGYDYEDQSNLCEREDDCESSDRESN